MTVLQRVAWGFMLLGGAGLAVMRWYSALRNGPHHEGVLVMAAAFASICVGIALFVHATGKSTPRTSEQEPLPRGEDSVRSANAFIALGSGGHNVPFVTIRRWGSGMVVVAFLAGALTVGAIATATASFNDSGVSCGAAVSTALHGKQAVSIGGETGTSSLLAVTSENRQFLTGGLVGLSGVKPPAPTIYTVCRQPARGRILVSAVLLATAVFGIAFSARRSTRVAPTREPTPVLA